MPDNQFSVKVPNIYEALMAGEQGYKDASNTINENNIKALPFSQTEIRLVTHLDFTDDMLNKTIEIFKRISF